jgi:N-acetylglucosaminylphosphatidylinositol deacetylase
MFFAPTVLALTKPELGNHLKILCFSTGNAAGLGETRKKELQKSAMQLGLRDESDVFIVDDPERFPDSMQAQWSETEIASLLASAFAPELTGGQKYNGSSANTTTTAITTSSSSKQRKQKQQQAVQQPKQPQHSQLYDGPAAATIDVLLTFDQHGISNHPNHRSLYHGAVHFLRELMKDKAGYTCPVTLYTLTSTSILRKYAGVLDAPVTMFLGAWSNVASWFSSAKSKSKSASDAGPVRLLFVSSIGEWMTAQSAMVKGHASQMVWFRWGWITLGRYMTVNDLKREKV